MSWRTERLPRIAASELKLDPGPDDCRSRYCSGRRRTYSELCARCQSRVAHYGHTVPGCTLPRIPDLYVARRWAARMSRSTEVRALHGLAMAGWRDQRSALMRTGPGRWWVRGLESTEPGNHRSPRRFAIAAVAAACWLVDPDRDLVAHPGGLKTAERICNPLGLHVCQLRPKFPRLSLRPFRYRHLPARRIYQHAGDIIADLQACYLLWRTSNPVPEAWLAAREEHRQGVRRPWHDG